MSHMYVISCSENWALSRLKKISREIKSDQLHADFTSQSLSLAAQVGQPDGKSWITVDASKSIGSVRQDTGTISTTSLLSPICSSSSADSKKIKHILVMEWK